MKKLFFIKLVVGVQLLLISFYLMAGDGGDGRVRVTNLSTETITVSFYACYVIHLCHEVTLPPDYHFTYAYQTWWTTENIIRVKGHIDPTGFRRPVDSTQLSRESDALSECIYFGKKGDPYNSTVNPASQVEGIKCFLPKHREMALQKIA
ncbi:MAG: hypothetical protein KZQ63_10535, partial [Candidatus Thiodiazotropha sp. (ex Lucinoma aequizonata)]|nr:hypothetical protein [Candidatus Thiodiazotropha sp. (ex Lucinoma aequizonata)]